VLLLAAPAWGDDTPQRVKGTGGWQDYTKLRIALSRTADGPHSDMEFRSTGGEMLATVTTPDGNTVTQFVIPSAVYLSRGLPEEYARKADTLDAVGLQSQLFLMFLEKAFPDGPASIQDRAARSFREETDTHELHFLGAAVTFPPGWEADVKAERTSDTQIAVDVNYKSLGGAEDDSFGHAVWDNAPRGPVLPDGEPLSGWMVNYFGTDSVSATGERVFKALVGDTDGLTTVGDVREAVKRLTGR
jgi:hypothetical protein